MKSGAFVWTFATDYVHSSHSKVADQMWSCESQSFIHLLQSMFFKEWGVCLHWNFYNFSKRLHCDHRDVARFFFNEAINACPFHVHSPSRQCDSDCQTQSLPPLTVGPIKAWLFWSDSLKQFFTWRRKKGVTIMLLIMWGRRGSAGVMVSFKKLLLIKFNSFCLDLCVKSLKVWSGTGAGSCRSKQHLSSFAWPLKWTQRATQANFCISIRIEACWGISSLELITGVLCYSHSSFSA